MKIFDILQPVFKALDDGLEELGITEEQKAALYDRMRQALKGEKE